MAEDSAPAFHLRDAVAEDMGEVARIYAHYVQTSCYTFEEVPPTAEEMRARLRQVRQNGLPWRVVEGRGGAVLGYVYAAPFRARSAYRYTVENSVYVAPDQAQRGAGMALMRDRKILRNVSWQQVQLSLEMGSKTVLGVLMGQRTFTSAGKIIAHSALVTLGVAAIVLAFFKVIEGQAVRCCYTR